MNKQDLINKMQVVEADYKVMIDTVKRPDDMSEEDFQINFENTLDALKEISFKTKELIAMDEPTVETEQSINGLWTFHNLFLQTRVPADSELRVAHDKLIKEKGM